MAAGLAGILEHGQVLGAANDERVEITERRRFVHPVLGGPLLADGIGDPDAPAAGAATEGVVAAARHVDQLAADQLQNSAGLVVVAVKPAKMAGVVERHPLSERLDDGEPPALQQLGEDARVVADRCDIAEVGVLVADGVVAVGVGGHDRIELLGRAHRLQVVLGEGFKEPFLADPAHVVAGGPLALVEQAEVEPRGAEEPRDRARDVLVARVVGGVVAHEPEVFGGLGPDVLDRELQGRRPAAAAARALTEAVAAVGDHVEGVAELLLHGAVLDQLAPHLHDHRRMLDADRADLHAGATGAAGPEHLRLDHVADQRSAVRSGPEGALRGVGAQVEYQVARAERCAAGGGRASLVATAALGAGVQVEQVLPRELGDAAEPHFRLGVVCDGPAGRRGLGQAAQGESVAGGQRAEHGEDVLRLGPGNARDEGQGCDAVDPPVGAAYRSGGGLVHAESQEDLGEHPADRRPRPPWRSVHGEPHGLLQEAGHPDQQQRPEKQRVVPLPGAGARARLRLAAILPPVGELRGPDLPAAPHHVDDAHDQPEAGEIGDQAEGEVEVAVPEGEAEERLRNVVLDGDDAGRREQQEEAVEDGGVGMAGGAVAPVHGSLREDVEQHAPEAAPRMDRNRTAPSAGVAVDVPDDAGEGDCHRRARHHEEKRVAEGAYLPEELAGFHRFTRP